MRYCSPIIETQGILNAPLDIDFVVGLPLSLLYSAALVAAWLLPLR